MNQSMSQGRLDGLINLAGERTGKNRDKSFRRRVMERGSSCMICALTNARALLKIAYSKKLVFQGVCLANFYNKMNRFGTVG